MLIAAAFTACSNDEGNDYIINDATVKVISTQTSIEAAGGEGKVVVDKAVMKAYSEQDWLSVSADGSEVSFIAQENIGRESRCANLVIKSTETDSVIVSVSQYGIIFTADNAKDISLSNVASTATIPVETTGNLRVVSAPEWVKATVVEDGINLDIEDNTTGSARSGWVVFAAGNIEDKVSVSQFDATDVFGKYMLTAVDATTGKDIEPMVCEIDAKSLSLPGLGLKATGTFSESAYTLSIKNGNYMGTYNGTRINAMFTTADKTLVYSILSSAPKGDFVFKYDLESGKFTASLSGTYRDSALEYMYLEKFKTSSINKNGDLGTLMALKDIKLVEVKE